MCGEPVMLVCTQSLSHPIGHVAFRNFVLCRCGLLVFALLKLCRYHQQENIRVRPFFFLAGFDLILHPGEHGEGEEEVDQ